MTVVDTTFEAELATNLPNNMFKALGGIIYTADIAAVIPTAFTDTATANLIQLDSTIWHRLGLLTQKDGVVFARSIKEDDETSWGYEEPTRSDITQDITTAAFAMQEVNRYTLELYHSVDLSAVHPDAVTGEVQFNKPQLTVPVYRRMIYLGVDGVGTDRRYQLKIMPRAHVTTVKDETWQQSTVNNLAVTVTATVDTTLGYSVRHVYAGPGQLSRNAAAHLV